MDNLKSTLVIMVSIGDRTHISDYTFPQASAWAAVHGYSILLLKEALVAEGKAPHFNKLIAHRAAPGFDRYIVIDDDLMLRKSAPKMEDIPAGYVGLCADVVQTNTDAPHVTWTGNTGFIVADQTSLSILEEAYRDGEYITGEIDGKTNLPIWGPYDQAALNNTLFKHEKAFKLDPRWNYQAVIDFYACGKGWDVWRKSKLYRIWYYVSVFVNPFGVERKKLNAAYGIHMTMGLYPKFFAKFHK